jgi:hypothetical protein
MPRPAVCPHCQEELDIPAEFRGRQVRCASCQKVFVPPAEQPAPPSLPAPGSWEEERPSRRPVRDDSDRPSSRPAPDDSDRFDDRAPWEYDRPPRPRKKSTLWVWLLILGFFGLCVLPCGGFFVLGVWVAFPDFQPYDSPEGRFRGEFPVQPFTYTRADDDGRTWHCTEYKRSFPPETYFVRYVDLPRAKAPAAEKALADAADKLAARVPGSTELRRTSGTTDGHPSVDLTLEHPDDTVTAARLVLVGTRLYEVGVTGMIDRRDADDDPRVKHFLDAFKAQTVPEGK